jgi:hypothetical protein
LRLLFSIPLSAQLAINKQIVSLFAILILEAEHEQRICCWQYHFRYQPKPFFDENGVALIVRSLGRTRYPLNYLKYLNIPYSARIMHAPDISLAFRFQKVH